MHLVETVDFAVARCVVVKVGEVMAGANLLICMSTRANEDAAHWNLVHLNSFLSFLEGYSHPILNLLLFEC